MTLVFFLTIGFFFVFGVVPSNSQALTYLKCVPNNGNSEQFIGLDNNTTGNCVSTNNNSTTNVTTEQANNQNPLSTLSALVTGVDVPQALASITIYLSVFAKGWIYILDVIFGGGPLGIFVWLIGLPLQLLQLYFIFQFGINIFGIFRGAKIF